MPTRIVTPTETQGLRQALADAGFLEFFDLLADSRLRIVDAPEIGCMPILREQTCQIEASDEHYERLQALTELQKCQLLQVLKQHFEAEDGEITLTEVNFFRQS